MSPRLHHSAYRAGFLVFVFLFIHAILFYKERMVMPDASFYLFQMISWHSFAVMHFRFVGMLTECLPVVAIKMHASLSTIALLYSIAFPLFYLACYILCGWLFKNVRLALALLIYLILFSTHTHYWMLSEQSLGLGVLCVSLAAVTRSYTKKWVAALAYLFAAIGLVFVGFAHPLLIFAVAFAVLFLWKEMPERKIQLIALAAFYLLVVFYKSRFYHETYEATSMGGMRNFKKLFPDYFRLYSNKRFLQNCLGKWAGIPVTCIAILIVYIKQKKWYRLFLFGAFFGGFLMLVNICYPDSYPQELYMENLYLLLGWFIALPLIWDVYPALAKRRLAFPAFSALAVVCMFRIWNMHHFYTARLNWERGVIKQAAGRKLILSEALVPYDTMLYNWCIPYEIWLLSTIEQQNSASIAVHESGGLMPGEGTDDPRILITTWRAIPYYEMPPPYFLFKDTTSVYKHLWEKADWP